MPPPENGVPSEEAFEILGHETRLAILHALWEIHEGEAPPDSPVTFTTLRKHVEMRDGSQFNYHLGKLTGRFVEKTDQGYLLQRPGYRLISTVLSATGMKSVDVSPQPFEFDCEYCGAETLVGYHDEYLYHVCTECVGSFGERTSELVIPESESDTVGGLLGLFGVDPNWATESHTMDIEDLFLTRTYQQLQAVLTRLCNSCAGEVHGTVDICDDHEASAESVCQTCDRRYRVRVEYQCSTCKVVSGTPPGWVVVYHPVTVQFAYERGMAIGQPNNPDSLRDTYELAQGAEVTVTDEQAPEITVDFAIDSDRLRFRLDSDTNILDIDERASTE